MVPARLQDGHGAGQRGLHAAAFEKHVELPFVRAEGGKPVGCCADVDGLVRAHVRGLAQGEVRDVGGHDLDRACGLGHDDGQQTDGAAACDQHALACEIARLFGGVQDD